MSKRTGRTSLGTTFRDTLVEARKIKAKLEAAGYTNIRIKRTSKKIYEAVKEKYEITYTIHWAEKGR